MAQSSRRGWRASVASGLALALAAAMPARAGYVGDMPIFDNSGAAVWTGAHDVGAVGNRAGASILNEGAATGAIVDNGGVVRNAPGATWNGDLTPGANVAGAELVNQGSWNGVLANAGGGIDNSGTAARVENAAGAFANEGAVAGGLANAGQATNNGAIAGGVANKGLFVNNGAGAVAGGLVDAGATANNGLIAGGVAESGAFTNNSTGRVTGGLRLDGGSAANNGVIAGGATVAAGAFVDNGILRGGATVAGALASLTVNGVVAGKTINDGALIENGAGRLKGRLVNTGEATINGALLDGAASSGRLTINASGRIAHGLVVDGGVAQNAGAISGGAIVKAGALTTGGAISGGLVDAGLVKATGAISGRIVVSGEFVVGDGAASGAKLALASGSRVDGVVTMPVDLATGKANFLAAAGAALGQARLDLTGRLANAGGAYWGRLSFSDAPIALTDAARRALAAASGPLYVYSDPGGVGITQTINSGLGVTAAQVSLAAATAFALALAPPPSDFERAPADPTPNLGAGAVWSRGLGADLALSGENRAATGPAFDATRLGVRLAGGEFGVEYGLHNIENSGLSARLGVEGGEAAGGVADANGGGSATLDLPFLGAYAALSGLGFTGRAEARYALIDMRLTDAALAAFGQRQRAAGMTYALSASYRIPLGALFVEPGAGLDYARFSLGDEASNVGALAFAPARLALGHAGAKLGGEFASGALRVSPYVLGEVWREWLSGATVCVPAGPTVAPLGPAGFEEVGLGVSATLARSGLTGYAQGAGAFGAKIAGISAAGGLRFDF